MYKIISIDGTDGSGKATIMQKVKDKLTSMGYRVVTIEPPFYESKTGQLIKEYLTTGYGDITNRWVVSQMYSFDRNMWMKENFHLFLEENTKETGANEGNPCFTRDPNLVFLYNRNWLSNLLYQTTIDLQSESDEKMLDPFFIQIPDSNGSSMRHCYNLKGLYDLLAQMKGLDPQSNMSIYHRDVAMWAAWLRRAHIAVDMMHQLYRMEIEPWRASMPDLYDQRRPYDYPVDFIMAADRVINIVLLPHKEDLDVIYGNMMKRYEGDSTKMDRNEKSHQYMAAVIENIEWLHDNWEFFTEDHDRNQKAVRFISSFTEMAKTPISEVNIIPLRKREQRAFQFHPIYTTQDGVQHSIDEVLADVWKSLNPIF